MNLESIRTAQSGLDVADRETLDDIPMLILVPNRPFQSFLFRMLDILISFAALLLLMPIFLLISLAIKFDTTGPVLFMQERVGKDGKFFKLFKFRSMVVNAEAQRQIIESMNERGNIVFKIREDPRVTRVGKIIRRLSLDELPQLINILRGEMSLVGPRPALPREVEQYSLRDKQRLAVTPGLTGLWQVSGRASLSFDKMVDLDLHYIQHRTVWLNIRIIVLTVPAVVTAKGAY